MGIGNLIRKYRIMNNMSQAELAYRAKTEPSSISRWENDKGSPNAESMQSLAKALGVKIWDLMEETAANPDYKANCLSNAEYINNVDIEEIIDKYSQQNPTNAKIVIEREEGDKKTRVILPCNEEMFGKVRDVLEWLSSESNQKNT